METSREQRLGLELEFLFYLPPDSCFRAKPVEHHCVPSPASRFESFRFINHLVKRLNKTTGIQVYNDEYIRRTKSVQEQEALRNDAWCVGTDNSVHPDKETRQSNLAQGCTYVQIEISSPPSTLSRLLKDVKIVLSALKHADSEPHTPESAGMHLHMSITNSSGVQGSSHGFRLNCLRKLFLLNCMFQEQFRQLIPFYRIASVFCRDVFAIGRFALGDKTKAKLIEKLEKVASIEDLIDLVHIHGMGSNLPKNPLDDQSSIMDYHYDRHRAINLVNLVSNTSKRTIEFRSGKSSTDFEEVSRWILTLSEVVRVSEEMKWLKLLKIIDRAWVNDQAPNPTAYPEYTAVDLFSDLGLHSIAEMWKHKMYFHIYENVADAAYFENPDDDCGNIFNTRRTNWQSGNNNWSDNSKGCRMMFENEKMDVPSSSSDCSGSWDSGLNTSFNEGCVQW